MSSRFISPFFDAGNGITPSSGAKLFFFELDGVTPRDTFSDEPASTSNANPVISDANGLFGDIWIVGSYKVILQDKNSVQIWEGSPIRETPSVTDTAFNKNFATLAAAAADVNLVDGDGLNLVERITGDGGWAMWDVVLASSVTPNTYEIVICTGVPTLALELRVDNTTTTTQFGAPFGGTVDAVPALQNYFDYCITNKVDVVFDEGRTYYLNSFVASGGFSNGCIILEDYDGKRDFHIHGNNSKLLINVNAHLLRINATTINDKFDGLVIENLAFESTELNHPQVNLTVNQVHLKYCKNVTVRGCTFNRLFTPIKFKICDNVLADNNRVTFCVLGIYSEGDTQAGGTEKGIGVVYTNNFVDHFSYGLECKLTDNIIMHSNILGVNVIQDSGGDWHYGIAAVGGQSAQGIVKNVIITNNIIRAAGDGGCVMIGVENGLVSNNIIKSSMTSGVLAFGNNLKIESNVIENAVQVGVKFATYIFLTPDDDSYYDIIDNKIANCGQEGILMVSDTLEMGDVSVLGNSISNTSTSLESGFSAIRMYKNVAADYPIKTITIDGNKIDKATKRGVDLFFTAGQGLKQLDITNNYIARDPTATDAHLDAAIAINDVVAETGTIDNNLIFGVSGSAPASWDIGILNNSGTALEVLKGNNHIVFTNSNDYALNFTPTIEYLNNPSLASTNANAIPSNSDNQLEIRDRKGVIIGYVAMHDSAW